MASYYRSYGGSSEDRLRRVLVYGDYIFVVGKTASEGVGSHSGLVLKFAKSDLSLVARKKLYYLSTDYFTDLVTDGANLFIAGTIYDAGTYNPVILKLDMNLNFVAIQKYDARIIDRVRLRIEGGYLYCVVSKAGAEPLAEMGILLKINKTDLSIAGQFGYGGDVYNKDDVWEGLWVDAFYAYLVGSAVTNAELGAWLVKVDTSTMALADEAAYIFTPSRTGTFFDVVGDSLNLYCVGGYYNDAYSELGAIVKISKATLNVVAQKPYGSLIPPASYFNNEFYGVQIDDDYVYVVGYCDGNEAFGGWAGLLVKLSKSDLSFVARTVLGGIASDYTWHEAVDVDANNIFAVGVTKAKGPGNYSGLITKWDMNLSISGGLEDFKAKQSVQGVGVGLTKDAHSLTDHAPGIGTVAVPYTYNDSTLTLSSLELILDGVEITHPRSQARVI